MYSAVLIRDLPVWKPAEKNNETTFSMSPQPTSSMLGAPSDTGMGKTREWSRQASSGGSHFRWVICTLLLFGVTNNYIDRQVLGVLKLTLQHDLGWNDIEYGHLVFAFQAAYATGMLAVGWLIDRLGTRLGYALAIVFWSLAAMGHAVARSFAGFIVARSFLGFGEAGVFPASIKSVAEWFPNKERSLAIGIFNAGTNLGAIVTPFLVAWITKHWGWRWAFIGTGGLGFVWLIFWFLLYRKPEEHPRVSKMELDYIRSDPSEPVARVRWFSLASYRQTWAFVIAKFMLDPIWWFYLFWIPDFLQRRHALPLTRIGVPILVIYVLADLGSVAGGWFSSSLIKRGKSVNLARKGTMLVSALCALPIVLAYRVDNVWAAVLLIGLAAGGHQGFSANLFALTSDTFPARAVGSVVGMGGMAGAIGGMLIAEIVGYTLEWTGSYMVPFLIAGSAYIVALAWIHILAPKLEPAVIC
jgi:MFS transporter, ACS family, aldohexuronate transporter